MTFSNIEGIKIVYSVINAIKSNREYLSEIDGAAGDGDHGINMSKGFSIAEEEIKSRESASMSEGFLIISDVLVSKIGGSMGPLYGNFFRGLYAASRKSETIDKNIMLSMLEKACSNLSALTDAKPGDKTLIDVLVPAVLAYKKSVEQNCDFKTCLENMMSEAEKGLESTKDMIAKLGRSSRLGERSRGHLDAGAASCCIILRAITDTAVELLNK
ncbi:dihydroxyacetone kinase subunit DhaL [Sebaldella sp. S0638]|uniref:dihydroxyacetone kinase subunit DhaL n=1 Tax=Sebaldella sp. S0638 TaxID=2957809 RepID=UPI0020A180FF|nr:dihydroxyacetone kinase subunit DhaL [Sebaldella sp. S0638]MCP1224202.1 dihydroxyacetone kinase subunit DhaL [Sebaldella sp. S0638]